VAGVRFPEESTNNEEIFNVVQPDLLVVCDDSKLDDKGCLGAPDIVVEILSPFTSSKDVKIKFDLYEKMGVKEYWVIYPHEKVAMVYIHTGKEFGKPVAYTLDDKIATPIMDGLEIELKQVFSQ
jgi:Uma2 family endonuclease